MRRAGPAARWTVHSLISDVFVLPRRLRPIELIPHLIYDAPGMEGCLSEASRATGSSPASGTIARIAVNTSPLRTAERRLITDVNNVLSM